MVPPRKLRKFALFYLGVIIIAASLAMEKTTKDRIGGKE